MARQPRIEFEGALYHVMARGDRREPIVLKDEDREDFVKTLGRACSKTGWRVHAWVLMTNHYHWILETPKANLVEGMKWFQNTYTRHFNIRNRQWGHVFGGRYKAVVVDPEDRDGMYFAILLDYVHLNPVRAGMVDVWKGRGLLDYRWSSLAQGYAVAPSRRAPWMETTIGFGVRQYADAVEGRRAFVRDLEKRALEERLEAGAMEPDGQTLHSTLRRGWYWGSETLKEKLQAMRSGTSERNNSRDYRLSDQGRDDAHTLAEALVKEALVRMKLDEEALKTLPGSDPRKVEIAAMLRDRTTVSQGWMAERLAMRSAGNVSQQLYRGQFKKEKRTAE